MGVEVRAPRPDELDQLASLSAYEWGGNPEDFARELPRRLNPERNAFAAVDDGRLVAQALVYELATWRNGREIALGALADVVTAPERRREGLGRAVLLRVLAAMREQWQQPLAMLFPTVPQFYRRLGWMTVGSSRMVAAAPSAFRPYAPPERGAGTLDLHQATPADVDLLLPLYEQFAAPRSCYLHRNRWVWEELVFGAEAKRQRWLAAWHDATGALGGYLVYELQRTSGTTLRVRDLCASSSAAYRALLSFVAGHNTVDRVRVELGPDVPWDHLVDDPMLLSPVEVPIQVMVRIVDVPSALAGPADDADVAHLQPRMLRVVDASAPWNDGAWEIGVDDGRWHCRAAAGGEADATVEIGTLSALFVGGLSIERAVQLGELEIHEARALPVLERLCRTAFPAHCPDRF